MSGFCYLFRTHLNQNQTVSLVALVLLGELSPHASQGCPILLKSIGLAAPCWELPCLVSFLPPKQAGVHIVISQLQGNSHLPAYCYS